MIRQILEIRKSVFNHTFLHINALEQFFEHAYLRFALLSPTHYDNVKVTVKHLHCCGSIDVKLLHHLLDHVMTEVVLGDQALFPDVSEPRSHDLVSGTIRILIEMSNEN